MFDSLLILPGVVNICTIYRLCPKFGEYEKQFLNSPVWLNHYKAVTYPLLTAVSKAVNFTVGRCRREQSECMHTFY